MVAACKQLQWLQPMRAFRAIGVLYSPESSDVQRSEAKDVLRVVLHSMQ